MLVSRNQPGPAHGLDPHVRSRCRTDGRAVLLLALETGVTERFRRLRGLLGSGSFLLPAVSSLAHDSHDGLLLRRRKGSKKLQQPWNNAVAGLAWRENSISCHSSAQGERGKLGILVHHHLACGRGPGADQRLRRSRSMHRRCMPFRPRCARADRNHPRELDLRCWEDVPRFMAKSCCCFPPRLLGRSPKRATDRRLGGFSFESRGDCSGTELRFSNIFTTL